MVLLFKHFHLFPQALWPIPTHNAPAITYTMAMQFLRQSQCQRQPALPLHSRALAVDLALSWRLPPWPRWQACASYNAGPTATAQLQPTRGNTTAGTVQFAQTGDVVKVSGTISRPQARCRAWLSHPRKRRLQQRRRHERWRPLQPRRQTHGHHGKGEHHTGDLPSLKADANGTVSFNFESRSIRVGSTGQ